MYSICFGLLTQQTVQGAGRTQPLQTFSQPQLDIILFALVGVRLVRVLFSGLTNLSGFYTNILNFKVRCNHANCAIYVSCQCDKVLMNMRIFVTTLLYCSFITYFAFLRSLFPSIRSPYHTDFTMFSFVWFSPVIILFWGYGRAKTQNLTPWCTTVSADF